MKLDPVAAGLAGGTVLGLFGFLLTLISIFTGYGEVYLAQMVELHPGYAVSMLGSVVAFLYGFIEGFMWGYAGAFFYNKFAQM